jgi:hypothetical protein
MAHNRTREIDEALIDLAARAGAQIEFEPNTKGGHRRVYFALNGRTQFNVLTGTPSSGGCLNAVIRQARRTLKDMGASFEDAEPVLRPVKTKRPKLLVTLSPVTIRPRVTLARALGLPEPTPDRVRYFEDSSRRRRRRVRCWRRLTSEAA